MKARRLTIIGFFIILILVSTWDVAAQGPKPTPQPHPNKTAQPLTRSTPNLPLKQPSPTMTPNRGQSPKAPTGTNRLSINFENLPDLTPVTNQYANIGVFFSGATILSQGGSLNYLNFPPRSGFNVIYDDPSYGGGITINFDPSVTGQVSAVGGYITGNTSITMIAYDVNSNVLGTISTGGPNYAAVGVPNQLLQISSSTPIAQVVFHDTGNTFTVDDFYFDGQQSCQIANVPLLKQDDSAWANDDYGGTTSNPWIDYTGSNAKLWRWGCALTSTTMLINYYGLQQNGFTTTPRDLNNWLKAHGGYSSGDINWFKVAEYARNVAGLQFYFYPGESKKDDGVVNAFLCNSSPIILGTVTSPYANGHYVVATGQAGTGDWNINDPGQNNLSQLNSSSYNSIRAYGTSPTDPTALYVAAHSPIQFLVTDPAGRKTGYDPTTGQVVNNILDADYGTDVIGARDGSGNQIQALIFDVGAPLSGTYSVQLFGTGNGPYELDFMGYDASGDTSSTSVTGNVTTGSIDSLTLTYSNTPGSQISVTHAQFLPLILKSP